jgi:UDP-glucose 4-epimerase
VSHNRQGFLPWFIHKAIDGEVIELFGEGKQKRDMNYVEDVVEALLLAGASEAAEGEILNLGGDTPVTLLDIAEELISITGRGSLQCVPFPAESRLIDIGNSYSSYQKIESLLGWHPRTPLREGLIRTVEFYQKHRDHYWHPICMSPSLT